MPATVIEGRFLTNWFLDTEREREKEREGETDRETERGETQKDS